MQYGSNNPTSHFSKGQKAPLKVVDSRGRLHVLEVNWDMSAADLRQLIDGYEQDSDYRLLCEDWWIDRQEMRSLRSLRLRPYSKLRVVFDARPVELLFEGRVIPLGEVRTSASFSALLALARSHVTPLLPSDSAFVCACGRVVSDENPQRRRLPRRCCEEGGALRLRLEVPADFSAPARGPCPAISCRLPPGASPALFEQLSAVLQPPGDLRAHHRLEAILREVLRLQGAKNAQLRFPERTHFVIDVRGERLPWAAAPATPLSDVLCAVRDRCRLPRALDFSVRGGRRRLRVLERPALTLEAAAIREGQELKLELRGCRGKQDTDPAHCWLAPRELAHLPNVPSRSLCSLLQNSRCLVRGVLVNQAVT